MKKYRMLEVLLVLALLFSLAACGDKPVPAGNTDGTVPTEIPAPTTTPEEQIPDGPGTIAPLSTPAVDHCELVEAYMGDAEEVGTLTAYDAEGNVLWEYVTEDFHCTELTQVQSLGAGKDGWLLLCCGELRCIADGEVVWCNPDFGGAGACWDFGPDGTLYLAGSYGPALMVVDSDGKTLERWESFDSETFWPAAVNLTEDGMVDITYFSDYSVLRVDPNTGVYEFAGWDYSIDYENPVCVSTTEEFIRAIDHGVAIIMEPGVYNITEFLNENTLTKYFSEGSTWQSTGVLVNDIFDGQEIVISGINDLTIRSADPENPAEIVCEPRYADVLSFYNCDNLALVDVVLGHTPEQGHCEGDVLALNGCRNSYISGVDLYGCGAYAMTVSDCRSVYVFRSRLHDCTYGVATVNDTDVITFDNVTFADCREYTMFELSDCEAYFYDSSFTGMHGNMVSTYNAFAGFYGCTFDVAALESIQQNYEYGSSIIVQ